MVNEVRISAGGLLAAVLLMISGVLNIVYGIAAIGNSSFFVHNAHYVFGNLKTWGWVTLILGVLQVIASLSLFRAGAFGRYFAIAVAALMAIASLFEIPDYPFWSLAVFALSLWIIHGLTTGWTRDAGWGESGPPGPTPPSDLPRRPV
jgi:hypothetical protein